MINWSSYNAVEEAQKVFVELGGNLNKSTINWLELANAMRKATNAIPDFSGLRT
jgi:hypothetical protein